MTKLSEQHTGCAASVSRTARVATAGTDMAISARNDMANTYLTYIHASLWMFLYRCIYIAYTQKVNQKMNNYTYTCIYTHTYAYPKTRWSLVCAAETVVSPRSALSPSRCLGFGVASRDPGAALEIHNKAPQRQSVLCLVVWCGMFGAPTFCKLHQRLNGHTYVNLHDSTHMHMREHVCSEEQSPHAKAEAQARLCEV